MAKRNLNDLMAFITVAREGSFRGRVLVSPSSVTSSKNERKDSELGAQSITDFIEISISNENREIIESKFYKKTHLYLS